MKSLSELEEEATVQIACPRAEAGAIKAWAAGHATAEQQRLSYRFVGDVLAGTRRLGFALPATDAVMGWREGRRYVGLAIAAIVETPMKEEVAPEPRARTATAKAAARMKQKVEG